MLKKWMVEAPAGMFENREVVGVREWIASWILMLIPVANVIILFRWAFHDKTEIPASKVNLARATVVMLVATVIAVTAGFPIYRALMS